MTCKCLCHPAQNHCSHCIENHNGVTNNEIDHSCLTFLELKMMKTDQIKDKIAFALNCLTECPNHKISYCARAVGIPVEQLVKFD